MSVKINKLEIENVKRIKAVKLEPTANGLTVIGGRNNQGKTSVLDSIAWALGGENFRPSDATRDGSIIPPNLKIVLNNGLIVERKGKNSALKVTDPSGQKAGQSLLNTFVESLALNLPKFMESSGKEKAQTLLQIIGVGNQLAELEKEEKELYQDRLYIGRTADQKEKFAKEQPYYPDAPKDLVSPSALIRQQQDILAQNGENQRKREQAGKIREETKRAYDEVKRLSEQLEAAKQHHLQLVKDLETAEKSAADLVDQSTKELEDSISNIEEINRMVRANLDKEKAEDDAKEYRRQYDQLSEKITSVREKKANLLSSAELPLPDLSVKEGDGDTTQEHLIDRLEKLIFHISMVANISDENFGTSSGIAMKYKLQAMSNLEKTKERKFTSGMNRRYRLIFSNPVSGMKKDDWVKIHPHFTPNFPANLQEEAEIAKNLEGVVSQETQLGVLSIVDNVQDEIKKIDTDQNKVRADPVMKQMFGGGGQDDE